MGVDKPDNWHHLVGRLKRWPSKAEMAALLRAAGIDVIVGRYSIRVTTCFRFVFQQYGGDLGDPVIDADAPTLEALMRDADLISKAFSAAGISHRFEIYDNSDHRMAYRSHEWPEE